MESSSPIGFILRLKFSWSSDLANSGDSHPTLGSDLITNGLDGLKINQPSLPTCSVEYMAMKNHHAKY